MEVLPEISLSKINLEVFSRNVLGKDVVDDAGEGSSSRDMVHRERGHLCQVPQCPSEHSQPYRQVAAACLVGFAGGSSFTHPAKKHPDPAEYLGILQGTALEQHFYTEFLIKVIAFALSERMANNFPSRGAIT